MIKKILAVAGIAMTIGLVTEAASPAASKSVATPAASARAATQSVPASGPPWGV